MSQSFFSKTALEKLSTPEKLDQLITVTSPKGWIALLTVFMLLGTGVVWSVLGHVKTKVNAFGVVLGSEVHEVVVTTNGQLIDLKVKLGDKVEKGEIIAELDQPELYHQIEEVKVQLEEKKYELQKLLSYGSKDTQLQEELLIQQQNSIQSQINSDQKNLIFLENQFEIETELLDKGLITKTQLINTEQQIENAKNSIESLKGQLVQTSSQKLNVEFNLAQKIRISKQQIGEIEIRIKHLEERYDLKTNIKSSFSGEVVEILSESGNIVRQGAPLFKIKSKKTTSHDKLRGILYLSLQEGKKISEGMEVLIAPSTVKPQEYGFIKGKVTYVSDFPVTHKGMMMTVKNDLLVQGLVQSGALFEIQVELEKDKNTYSGFKWTSIDGPSLIINEGTSCVGKITVKTEPPIAIVIPALKKFFDLY